MFGIIVEGAAAECVCVCTCRCLPVCVRDWLKTKSIAYLRAPHKMHMRSLDGRTKQTLRYAPSTLPLSFLSLPLFISWHLSFDTCTCASKIPTTTTTTMSVHIWTAARKCLKNKFQLIAHKYGGHCRKYSPRQYLEIPAKNTTHAKISFKRSQNKLPNNQKQMQINVYYIDI